MQLHLARWMSKLRYLAFQFRVGFHLAGEDHRQSKSASAWKYRKTNVGSGETDMRRGCHFRLWSRMGSDGHKILYLLSCKLVLLCRPLNSHYYFFPFDFFYKSHSPFSSMASYPHLDLQAGPHLPWLQTFSSSLSQVLHLHGVNYQESLFWF